MSKEFAGALEASRGEISKILVSLSAASASESSLLTDGVVEMISSGRQTCSKLKESIQASLSTLLGDAAVAKESMTASCSQLDEHLNATNGHIQTTLLALQSDLSSWLVKNTFFTEFTVTFLLI